MSLLARLIAAIRNEPVKLPSHYCPYCFSKNIKLLGSNAARFKGNVQMVFTCLDCREDSMYNIFEDGTSSIRLEPCARQARCVHHAKAEIWNLENESDNFP